MNNKTATETTLKTLIIHLQSAPHYNRQSGEDRLGGDETLSLLWLIVL
jgi:hypothetical protein